MHRSPLLLASLALTGPLALAQTASHPTATHHATSSTAHRTTTPTKAAGPVCATLPPISSKIPALPASAGCPKPLFTVSDRLDYLAPIAERFRSTLFNELPVVISLDYADIAPGTGELAKPQQYYTVKYTGWLTDGSKFDSSEDHEETKAGLTFPYGAHRVIAGWDLGFEGMHIGGKRRLYIPYQFAYGAAGQPPKIPAKSMLVFDMELVSQTDKPPTPPTPPTPPSSPSGAPGQPVGSGPGTSTGAPPSGTDAKPTPPAAGQPQTAPPTAPSTAPSDTKPKPPQ